MTLLVMGYAQAQSISEITITGAAPSQVSGFGDVPLIKAPFSAVAIDQQTLQDIGAQRVSDALRLDASVADSYNSPAYWDMLSVRGYTLDNRYNYRREGLPISAETMIPMDNKERIELFKGTSGIQAGTSAPGGLVNYVVKRPPSAKDETIRSVSASYGPSQSSSSGLDLGGRFGQDKALGYRFNVAYENLDPYIRNTEGHRHLVALAMDWRISPDTKLEWEIERSERQQFGVNGYSLLANPSDPYGVPSLPATVAGQQNITRQPWSLPGVFASQTGSFRFKQNLSDGWLWTSQYGGQRLKTDDRLSFALGHNCYGVLDPTDGAIKLCDRFSSDGRFELADYRSNDERRLVDAFLTEVAGQSHWGSTTHHLALSLTRQRQLDRLPAMQAWNSAGEGSIYGGGINQASPIPGYPNTNKSEYSTEIAVKDRIQLTDLTAVWAGLRYTAYNRSSEQNAICDPDTYLCTPAPKSNAINSKGQITTPWLGLTRQLGQHIVFVSHGHGVELQSVPNTPSYSNAGQLLAVARSKQTEIGIRSVTTASRVTPWSWSASVVQIERPLAYDVAEGALLKRVSNGQQIHQGFDLGVQWRSAAWSLQAQGQWLHPRISDATIDTALNGQTPLNVPTTSLRALAQYRFIEVPGLRTSLRLSHEGARRVTEDGRINLPSWTTLDFATHFDTRTQGTRTQWTLGIDNLADRHYWRESPKQFGHYYLYPGAPRTVRVGVKASF
ncbi:TonB-dependent siderophore receptor [Limnohabitans sp. DCL3]|uniref:TonB-dependent siderophore receptor n=1 Tax=Limnohabitans sp. DCL3 TaxID=3374103 RepID=UPI003A89FEE4